jgi:hypothetical protein
MPRAAATVRKTVHFHAGVPLHTALKEAAAEQDLTVSQILRGLCRPWHAERQAAAKKRAPQPARAPPEAA